jgi:O-antigen/teichoic acid export membrane protein
MASSSLRTIARNTLYILMSGVAFKAVNFLYQIFIVRQLGGDRFGQFSIVAAWVGLFSIFAEWGVTQFATREMARDRSQTQKLFWNLVGFRMLLAVFGVIGITAGAAWFGYDELIVRGVFLSTLTFLIAAWQSPLEAVLSAHERLDHVSLQNVFGQIVGIALGSWALWRGLGVIELIAVGIVAMTFQTLFALWLVRQNGIPLMPITFTTREWKTLWRGGLPFGIITLSLVIAFSIDTVILSRFVSDQQVGWYNVAYRFASSLLFFFTAMSDALVPTLSHSFVENPDEVKRWYYRSLRVALFTGLPIAVGGMLLAEQTLLFLYGDSYAPASRALQIIIWDVPLLMFTSLCGNICGIIGEERAAARIYFINALSNLALNLLLIPFFGIEGAAVVTVVTDAIGTIQFMRLLNARLNLPSMKLAIAKVATMCFAMGIVLSVLVRIFALHIVGAAIVAALAYAIGLIAIGGFDETEDRLFRHFFTRFLPKSDAKIPS